MNLPLKDNLHFPLREKKKDLPSLIFFNTISACLFAKFEKGAKNDVTA